jgi:hypothetical protein
MNRKDFLKILGGTLAGLALPKPLMNALPPVAEGEFEVVIPIKIDPALVDDNDTITIKIGNPSPEVHHVVFYEMNYSLDDGKTWKTVQKGRIINEQKSQGQI